MLTGGRGRELPAWQHDRNVNDGTIKLSFMHMGYSCFGVGLVNVENVGRPAIRANCIDRI